MPTTLIPKSPAEAATAPGELYRRALAAEGLDPAAPGLLAAVERLHLQALTPALILRAYAEWRRATAAEAAKTAVAAANQKGGPANA